VRVPRRIGWLIAATPVIFVVTWSTGNIFTKLGLPHAEPFTFLTIRFALATLLLTVIALIFRAPWPTRAREIGHILVAGLQPLLTASIVGRLLGERVTPRQWAGLALGLVGVTLVVWRKLDIDEGTGYGMAFATLAMLSFTIGTIYQKRFCTTMDLKTGTAIQLAGAAVASLVLALVFETRVVAWTGEFVLALTWLIVVLTVGAYMLLFYLLAIGAASKVASMFYLTPPTTAVMGYFVFNETFGVLGLIGMAVAVVGYMMAVK